MCMDFPWTPPGTTGPHLRRDLEGPGGDYVIDGYVIRDNVIASTHIEGFIRTGGYLLQSDVGLDLGSDEDELVVEGRETELALDVVGQGADVLGFVEPPTDPREDRALAGRGGALEEG